MSVDWRDDASCKDAPSEWFFPPKNTEKKNYAKGKQVCAGCPVQLECLDFADSFNPPIGLWAGLTPADRNSGIGRGLTDWIPFRELTGFDDPDLWLQPQGEFSVWYQSNLEGLYKARQRRRDILDRVDQELREM